jgi:hypothetical protein
MSSPLLALFVRSLREDARGRATYWTRGGLGGFLLLILLGFALTSRWTGTSGLSFFIGIISLQMLTITLIGLSYFASAVAEEKEEQTLGLLRMTDLSPLAILLGKSTSRLCGALLLLAGQFPFTIIAVTFGGVSLGQVVAVYCTLGAFTFLFCNLALLGSVLARTTAGAAVFCIVMLVLFLLSDPAFNLLDAALVRFFNMHLGLDHVGEVMWSATPIARLREVLGTGFRGNPVGWQVASNLAFGVGCFLLAWAAFQRFCDRETDSAAGVTRTAASGELAVRSRTLRRSRPPRAWKDALVWKDFYFLCGGRMGFIIRTVCYGGALVNDAWSLATKGSAGGYSFGTVMNPIMPFVFSVDVAVMAARIFRTELRDQTLSALAILPCTMREIVARKVRACLFAAAPGAISSVAIQVLFLVFFPQSQVQLPNVSLHTMWIVQTATGWIHTCLLVTLVAWLSLHMKRGALPVGFVLTYAGNMLFSMVTMIVIGAISFSFRSFGSPNLSFLYISPLVAAAVSIALIWILHFNGVRRLEILAGEN